MEKIMLVLAFLSVLSSINCALDYDITERIGGDITGFLSESYTLSYYSDNFDDMTILVIGDTVINGSAYKNVVFDYKNMYFAYTDNYIYSLIEFNGIKVDVPFLNRILLRGQKYYKNEDYDYYSYNYFMSIDSLKVFACDSAVYDNAYFVTTSVNLSAGESDTSFINRYVLTNENGIVGIEKDGRLLSLDSVSKN